jgi:hypothetical protein
MIEPEKTIQESDRPLFIRFVRKSPGELVVLTTQGEWKWYVVVFRPGELKPYLVPRDSGEMEAVSVVCNDGESVGIFWADPELLPTNRIEVLPGGPCLRLPVLPQYLQGEGFSTFAAGAAYAGEMVYCAYCQDRLPVSALVPVAELAPCPHVRWCVECQVWSTPNYPGKVTEADPCPHRSGDDLRYDPPPTGERKA